MATLESIDVAVLCGARTRHDTPRVLSRIGDRLYIDWLLARLSLYGARRVILCAGYLSEQVLTWQLDRKADDMEIVVAVEPRQEGALGALYHARDKFRSDQILIVNDDTLCNADLGKLVAFHGNRSGVTVLYARKLGRPKYQNACHYLMSASHLDSVLRKHRSGSLDEATRERVIMNSGLYYDIESSADAEAFLDSMLEAA